MRKLISGLFLLGLISGCAKKALPETAIKGVSRFQLSGGAAISQPGTDEYNPHVVKMPDGFLVLLFGSNRSCGGCTNQNLFISRSVAPYANDAIFPAFASPTVFTVAATPLNYASAISFAGGASGSNLRIFLTNAGGNIQYADISPTGTYNAAALSNITNTVWQASTIVGIDASGAKLFARNNGSLYAFDPLGSDATLTAMVNGQSATSLAHVNAAFAAMSDGYFSLTNGTIGSMSFIGTGGNLEIVNTAVIKAKIGARQMSILQTGTHNGDLMFISGIESGSSTQDMYVVDGLNAASMWGYINPKPPSTGAPASSAAGSGTAAPAFSPVAGTYGPPLNVTVTSATAGAIICYTTDGVTTPTCNATPACTGGSALYAAPYYVAVSNTIKAIACKAGLPDSSVTSGLFISDGNPPTISSVTSSTANGYYTIGQNISIQVVFNEVVNVTGTPQLTLATGTPATTAINYVSGSGSTTLTFTYTVASGNTSADLNYSSTAALGLNGGTIKDVATNNATLTLPATGGGTALAGSKAIVIDTTAPVISAVAPATSAVIASTSVSFTLSEAIASGNITFTWTSGTADGGSPHIQALTGTELNTGAHTGITLINNPTLVAGATYTVTFNATDLASNTAATITSTGVAFTSDATAPANVSTMAAGTVTASSIQLNWTAVGDDNNTGTATSYELRYLSGGSCPISAGTFATGTLVGSMPTPAIAGTATETKTVTGLAPSTSYCFAIKVLDEVPNTSGISNVVTQSTSAAASTTASRVYGQLGSYATASPNNGGLTADTLNFPAGIATDASGVYVVDAVNHRVLYFAGTSTTATRVYGQLGSFATGTANNGGRTANSLNNPAGVAVDGTGVYIVDTNNYRVLWYAGTSTTATRVYGQAGSFTTGNIGITANGFYGPYGIAVDASGVYVSDGPNHRVLWYSGTSTTATRVYGQLGSFLTGTANKGGRSADSLNFPYGIAVDATGVYIADSSNNRVSWYPGTSTTATRVYGQAGSFTTGTLNNGGLSATSLGNPYGVAVDAGGVYIADFGNNRALYFAGTATTATRVYGQLGSFAANAPNNGGISANSLSAAYGVTVDANGVYITEYNNHRVLFY